MPGAAVTGVIPNRVVSCEETTTKDKQFNSDLAGNWSSRKISSALTQKIFIATAPAVIGLFSEYR
jgi:hypothetical protein